MTRKLLRHTWLVCTLATITIAGTASPSQDAGPAQRTESTQPPPAIRATTRLVQVSVVVHDKHGNPITGLTKDDFVVLDEKKLQEVRVFSIETNDLPSHAPPALPPDTYTNRIQERGNVPTSITVILFDGLNTEFSDQSYARGQVVKFIRTQVRPTDRVAIYSLGRSLRIVHDFTNDASSLLAAIEKYKGRDTPLVDSSVAQKSNNPNPAVRAFLDNVYQREANFAVRDRVHQTVEALTAIANHVGTLPGRKNLVWVSGGFPFDIGFDNLETRQSSQATFRADTSEFFANDIETAARALTNANLAVYPVDARGLMPVSPAMSTGLSQLSIMRSTFDTMNAIADRTGGRAFYNRNDIWGAIRDALDDSRETYELGYYPQGIEWNGKFREIKVEVKRPGAHVRARKGYFALSKPKLTPELRQAIIALSAKSPLEPTGIGITVHLQKLSDADRTIRTVTAMDLHDFAMVQKQGRWYGTVDAVILQTDNKGEIINALDQTYHLHFDPATYQKFLNEGVTNTKDVAILPSAVELRVMLRDGTTGTIGGVNVSLAKYFPARSSSTE